MPKIPVIVLEVGKLLLTPSSILLVLLTVGIILLWTPRQRLGRIVTTITVITLLFVTILPVASWIAKPLETRFPQTGELPNSVVGIIVLGGSFKPKLSSDWNQPQLNEHGGRLIAFAELARKYPELRLVFTGGAAAFPDKLPTESDLARALFASLGMDTRRITFETRSRNTCENAIYTARLAKPLKEQSWALVTSAMDTPRAVGAFRKAGFQVLPYPVDYSTSKIGTLNLWLTTARNLGDFDHAIHEWLGLVAYYMMGCTDSLFPGPRLP